MRNTAHPMRACAVFATLVPLGLFGQWQSLDGGLNRFVHNFEYNVDSSKLIVGGSFPYAGDLPLRVNNLATWDGYLWSNEGLGNGNGDTSQQGSFFNNFTSLALFHDTLFCGLTTENFQYHHEWGQAAALWDNGWFSIGDPDNWFYVMKVNGRLFCGGRADTLYGQFMPGIKEWIGGHWQSIPDMPLNETGSYYCGTYWHDQYWFAGSYLYPNGRSVVAFDGVDTWTPNMGPGGGWINAIAGFGDSLYVGGWYPPGSDSESPMIQIWDGGEWQPFFPEILQFQYQIGDVEVYEGALYVCGVFFFLDDPSTRYSLLRFDGHELCAIGGVNVVGSNGQIAFFQGDLYMALASQFPGLEFQYIGRLPLAGLVPDRCVAVATGMEDDTAARGGIVVLPNPASGDIRALLPGERGTVRIMDMLGREVQRVIASTRGIELHTSILASGTYSIVFENDHLVRSARFIKE